MAVSCKSAPVVIDETSPKVIRLILLSSSDIELPSVKFLSMHPLEKVTSRTSENAVSDVEASP